jgi:hypothetical protein
VVVEVGEWEGADMEMLSPGERGMDGMKERVRVPIASSNMTVGVSSNDPTACVCCI